MTEARIAFLCKAATLLPKSNSTKSLEILKSYYMMRCKELSKGYGLPQKYFSEQARCIHCCLEWGEKTDINLKPVKLSKRQRKRIKSQKKSSQQVNKTHLLHSKELEQICAFCKHSTKMIVPKPNKPIIERPQKSFKEVKKEESLKNIKKNSEKIKETTNVYSKTAQVFCLSNKKNILKSTVKEEPKVIKNNKKKKDKFAGLCQKAVLASAKLKQQNIKQNKLSLFLKPSS